MLNLCAETGLNNLKDIISSVTRIINFLRAKSLVHREFRTYLESIDSNYADVILYTDVRWLSIRRMSERFCNLLPQIRTFFI